MASIPSVGKKLKLRAPVLKVEKDPAFYIAPPLLVAAVFAFCAYVPRGEVNAQHSSAAKVPVLAQAQRARVDLPDPNTSLPEFDIPVGSTNLLKNAEGVSVSAAVEGAPASHAVDGACADDAPVAVAQSADGTAWWQVELPQALAGQQIVIYGGGPGNPAGKLEGGFSVEVEYADGGKDIRSFCRDGFALEGYEAWKLADGRSVRLIRVNALKPRTPLVLREVQLIGPEN